MVVEKVWVEPHVVANKEGPVAHPVLSLDVSNAQHVSLALCFNFTPDPIGSVDQPTGPSCASFAPDVILPGLVEPIRNRVLDEL